MSISTGSVGSVFFPYCMQKLDDGSWVFLNRYYKPVGFHTPEYQAYEELQSKVSMKLKGIGQATLAKLSYDGKPSNKVYLYNDGCSPTSSPEAMESYLKKLKILLSLQRG